jgi:chain length determinant protein tyrosine kinase EpsG
MDTTIQAAARTLPATRGAGMVPSIGVLLIDAGKLTLEDAERVFRYQKEKGLRFGDAAVKLGLVNQQDIQDELARQFHFPYLRPGQGSLRPEVVAAYAPFSRPAEGLRTLRSQLMLRWFAADPPNRVLAVVSAARGDGRSFIAANLAVVFSQLGERTLLIDADMRNPMQHSLFGLNGSQGLSTILAARSDLGSVQRVELMNDLFVLPAGPIPPNPAELLEKPIFRQILEEVSSRFDVVILDTPAVAFGPDAKSICIKAKGALVVARTGASRIDAVKVMVDQFSADGATVIGSVVNNH